MSLSSMPEQPKVHALNWSRERWELWCRENKLPRFLGKQVQKWMLQKSCFDPELFSDVSKAGRELLKSSFQWDIGLTVSQTLASADGSEKILFRTHDGKYAECVVMPTENRVTMCVSSQVGCRMACTFCQTGKIGFTRHLTAAEIVGQILLGQRVLEDRGAPRTRVTNVVFMGMGEPLDNYDEVVNACRHMISSDGLGLSKHKVTVSTCGLIPEIERLGRDLPVRLAISLHSPDQESRSKMMPVNRRYPLADLKETLLRYPVGNRHGITFEYVMIDGVNDSLAHAKKLVKFLHGLKAKVNLIPMNEHPGSPMKESAAERVSDFQKYLAVRSIPAPVRYSKGQDVSAACGQLATKKRDELNQTPRSVALTRRRELIAESTPR